MKFAKYLTSVVTFFPFLFFTNSAFSQSDNSGVVPPPRVIPQIACKISYTNTIYINATNPVLIDGQDQLYLYYTAGGKPEGQLNTRRNSFLLPYRFDEIDIIKLSPNNRALLAIPNIDRSRIYHSVTVSFKDGRTVSSYLRVKPGKGSYYSSNSKLLKTFNLADCIEIKFKGM
jgi:hypothetical protein